MIIYKYTDTVLCMLNSLAWAGGTLPHHTQSQLFVLPLELVTGRVLRDNGVNLNVIIPFRPTATSSCPPQTQWWQKLNERRHTPSLF